MLTEQALTFSSVKRFNYIHLSDKVYKVMSWTTLVATANWKGLPLIHILDQIFNKTTREDGSYVMRLIKMLLFDLFTKVQQPLLSLDR